VGGFVFGGRARNPIRSSGASPLTKATVRAPASALRVVPFLARETVSSTGAARMAPAAPTSEPAPICKVRSVAVLSPGEASPPTLGLPRSVNPAPFSIFAFGTSISRYDPRPIRRACRTSVTRPITIVSRGITTRSRYCTLLVIIQEQLYCGCTTADQMMQRDFDLPSLSNQCAQRFPSLAKAGKRSARALPTKWEPAVCEKMISPGPDAQELAAN
jgi:hypothetical protein